MILVPDILGEVPGEGGVGAFGERWHASEIIRALEMITAHDGGSAFLGGLRNALRGVAAHCLEFEWCLKKNKDY